MTISEQIRVLCARLNVSIAELARRTGQSPQCLNGKMKRGSFTVAELEKIGYAVGADFNRKFVLPNGEEF
ncbi:hypothetical protein FACS1894188_05430 [Clostridia bacterium]|nr:hypothetical protein FACS1894188_05430 [Clostridia bacterium]